MSISPFSPNNKKNKLHKKSREKQTSPKEGTSKKEIGLK